MSPGTSDSRRRRKSASAPSSHSLMTSAHVVWAQKATAHPSVTPESLIALRRSSVRSMAECRDSGCTRMVRVADFTLPPSRRRWLWGDLGGGSVQVLHCLLLSVGGQDEPEPGTRPPVLGPDRSAVRFDHRLRDGQPDAG